MVGDWLKGKNAANTGAPGRGDEVRIPEAGWVSTRPTPCCLAVPAFPPIRTYRILVFAVFLFVVRDLNKLNRGVVVWFSLVAGGRLVGEPRALEDQHRDWFWYRRLFNDDAVLYLRLLGGARPCPS